MTIRLSNAFKQIFKKHSFPIDSNAFGWLRIFPHQNPERIYDQSFWAEQCWICKTGSVHASCRIAQSGSHYRLSLSPMRTGKIDNVQRISLQQPFTPFWQQQLSKSTYLSGWSGITYLPWKLYYTTHYRRYNADQCLYWPRQNHGCDYRQTSK